MTTLGLTLASGDNALSGVVWSRATNGWGDVELDRSNGENKTGDGHTLTLNGKTYARGYGVHASSQLDFQVDGRCQALSADIGVDDEVGSKGRVVFRVLGDGAVLFDSGAMTGASATRSVRVDITGLSSVRLEVMDGGDGTAYDHADWASPTLLSCTAPAPTPVVTGGLTPEQYGAKGDGVTDDTAALGKLFAALNTQSQPASFAAGRTYRVRRTTNNQFNVTRDGATLNGNGATLKIMDGETTAATWYIIRVAGPNITIQNLGIDANKANRPITANGPDQSPWFIDGGSRNVLLSGVRGLNSPADGMYVRDLVSPLPTTSAAQYPTNIRLENVELLNSGRNNLTIVGSRAVSIVGGRFNGAGGYGDGPWAGIDIEPNRGSDMAGNDGVTIDGAETSNNRGSGIDVAQINNTNITISNHTSNGNGTALFLSPSGTITVNGLKASGYGAVVKAGVIAVVPSTMPGATLKFSNLEISNATDTKPAFFQNYTGTVSLNGLKATNVKSSPVLGTWQPTTVSNVFVDGVQIK
ncbi:NPCBM/NEW2 domain-containing protein [Deinococcus sp.]|uniref:NPCBM/NEW2 domain-containing protein n=1 Tax=Deinococcus sp. TaxID=47478 RepID=UPI0028698C3F|nr:NPCBM/NEW2 domain-containing protein [Deinococcus sp.]